MNFGFKRSRDLICIFSNIDKPSNLAKFHAAAAEASKDRLPLNFSNK